MRDSSQLWATAQAFIVAGYTLIPINPNQKNPADVGWTTMQPYTQRHLKELIDQGYNVGCRLTPSDLIIDVDAKHPQGLASFDQLRRDVPELADLPYYTQTVNRGFHYYLSWPQMADKPRSSLKAYPGIDFLSKGRQALIGGSTVNDQWYHPGPAEFPAPPCPEALVSILSGGSKNQGPHPDLPQVGYGCIDPDILADALMLLNPAEFSQYDTWLYLMMSCHFLTGGAGLHVFAQWSQGDPKYSGHDITHHWESCGDKPGGRVYDLVQALRDRGLNPEIITEPLGQAKVAATFQPVDQSAGNTAAATLTLASCIERAKLIETEDQIIPLLGDMLKAQMETEMEMVITLLTKRFKNVDKTTLRNTIKQLKQQLNTLDPNSDEARARRYIEHVGGPDAIRHEGRVLWVWEPDRGSYHQYTLDNLKGSIMKYLSGRMIEIIPFEVKGMMDVVTGLADDKTPMQFWDKTGSDEGQMFNLMDGELWITSTGTEHRPHDMKHRRRGTINVVYAPDAMCPTWMRYIRSSFPVEEYDITTRKLAIGIAYSCTESVPFLKKCWYLHGPTNTGKSRVLDDVIRQLTQPAFNAITLNQLSHNNFALADLNGKLVNIQNEVPSAKFLESDVFKRLIAGDTINADRKNQSRATFAAQTVLWFAANDPIKFQREGSRGILERIVYIHYGPAQKILDYDMAEKLRTELPGIFRWAFDIYAEEYQRDKCQSVLAAMTETEEDEHEAAQSEIAPHLRWFDECLDLDPEAVVTTATLYDSYQAWQLRHPAADPVANSRGFANKFRNWIKDIPGNVIANDKRYIDGVQQRCWVGVTVKDDTPTEDPWTGEPGLKFLS